MQTDMTLGQLDAMLVRAWLGRYSPKAVPPYYRRKLGVHGPSGFAW